MVTINSASTAGPRTRKVKVNNMYEDYSSDEMAVLNSNPAYRRYIAAREGLAKEQGRSYLIECKNNLKRILRFYERREDTYVIISAVNAFVETIDEACGGGYEVPIAKKIKEKCFDLAKRRGYSGSRSDLEGQTEYLLSRGMLPEIIDYCDDLEEVLGIC